MKVNNSKSFKELTVLFPNLAKYQLLKNAQKCAQYYRVADGISEMSYLKKQENKLQKALELGKVKEIHMALCWTTGGAYGWQCYCLGGYVILADGRQFDLEKKHKTTGCGYDKLSTCAAGVLNDWMLCNLFAARRRYAIAKNKRRAPYGMNLTKGTKPYFDGGVGINSTINCLEFLGGKVTYTPQEKRDFLTVVF